jgi:acetyl esterase/lipase
LLWLGVLAAAGAAAIYAPGIPTLWITSRPYATLAGMLAGIQLALSVLALAKPTRPRTALAAVSTTAVALLWALTRVGGVLPDPDPWTPVNSVIGFTDQILVLVDIVAALGLTIAALGRPMPRRPGLPGVIASAALAPVALITAISVVVALIASTDGLTGAGLLTGVKAPHDLPAGQMSTVEYCRPRDVPLGMDLYMPAAATRRGTLAPVALYVHGGGAWGDRKARGPGAALANSAGALFGPLREKLNARGFVVASIDYRLPPGTPWPAQIQDSKCAVRFLRAHAGGLGIDPDRIGVWGSSGGGVLSALLALAGPGAGFDVGQYLDQSSRVGAVVDMFGPPDLDDLPDQSPFFRFVIRETFGDSPKARRAASPITYIAPGAPPFLVLQGTKDPATRLEQQARFVEALRAAGAPATLFAVTGAGHALNTPGEHPSAVELTTTVVDFLSDTLRQGL